MSKKRTTVFTTSALLTVLAVAGCYEPVDYPEIVGASLSPAVVLPARYRISGISVQRRPILSLVLGQGLDVTFILATIHGNEAAGTPLVRRLVKYLQQNPDLLILMKN